MSTEYFVKMEVNALVLSNLQKSEDSWDVHSMNESKEICIYEDAKYFS